MAKTFHQRPSEVARPLVEPDIPPGVLSALDWYAFDVAATARYQELLEAAQAENPSPNAPRTPRRRRNSTDPYNEVEPPEPLEYTPEARERAPVVETGGQGLFIRGSEIPPWER